MKNYQLISFISLTLLMTIPMFGVIREPTSEEIQSLNGKMIEFHKPTVRSKSSPNPDVKEHSHNILVAKLNVYGEDRYFVFQDNNDVAELAKTVQNGEGKSVYWYYVKPENVTIGKLASEQEPNMCNIAGLNKVVILKELHARSKLNPNFPTVDDFDPLTDVEAKAALSAGYIDYLKNRVMHVDLREDSFDPSMYNRDNGQGAAEKVIEELRRLKSIFTHGVPYGCGPE